MTEKMGGVAIAKENAEKILKYYNNLLNIENGKENPDKQEINRLQDLINQYKEVINNLAK